MPSPTVSQIRKVIADKIFALDPSIAVHEYERYSKSQSDLVAMYKSTDPLDANAARLNGYHIRRTQTAEDEPAVVGPKVVTHTWECRGFMSLDDADASETVFDEQIEAIRAAFRDDETLGGVVATTVVNNVAGMQLMESVPVLFAGILCHSARLQLLTRHYQ